MHGEVSPIGTGHQHQHLRYLITLKPVAPRVEAKDAVYSGADGLALLGIAIDAENQPLGDVYADYDDDLFHFPVSPSACCSV